MVYRTWRVLSVPLHLALAIGLVAASRAAHADFQYGGTLDSMEWLVDASSRIVLGVAIPNENEGNQRNNSLRITSVLKQPNDSTLEAGDTLTLPGAAHDAPEATRLLLFYKAEKDIPFVALRLPPASEAKQEQQREGGYFLPDKLGHPIRDAAELLERIAKRVEAGRKLTGDLSPLVSDKYFDYWPSHDKLETDDAYYYLRVPPDADFRKGLENGTLASGIGARSILYRYYSDKTAKQRSADLRLDLRRTVRQAAARFAKGEHCLRYQSVISYPEYRFCKVSPDGKHLAILEGDHLRLVEMPSNETNERANAPPLYETDGSYHHHDRLAGLIFSPDNKYFAHLRASGDVSIFNLVEKESQAIGKLGWPVASNTNVEQFTFSPDARYVALNLNHGLAGRGSAVVVWNTKTGERVYTKSPNWKLNKEFQLVGFGPYSKTIQVTESHFWSLDQGRPKKFIHTGWALPNRGNEPAEVDPPTTVDAVMPK